VHTQRIADLTEQDMRHEQELMSHTRQWEERIAEMEKGFRVREEEAKRRECEEVQSKFKEKVRRRTWINTSWLDKDWVLTKVRSD
jgi:hypothetical protein